MRSPARAALLALLAAAVAGAAANPYTWSRVAPAVGPSPPARSDAVLGFDTRRRLLVLFGGRSGDALGDTWIFNTTSSTWRQLGGPGPPPRFSMVAGMDQGGGRDRFLVAMGELKKGSFYNDVWALDLGSLTWSQVATSGTPPEARYGLAGGTSGSLAADVLLVSHGFASHRFDDTFALRLRDNAWINVTPRDPRRRPFARCLVSSALIDAHTMVMFGGCGSGGYGPCPANDASVLRVGAAAGATGAAAGPALNGAVWDLAGMETCPRPRIYSAMAPLPGRSSSSVVLVGGTGGVYGKDGGGVLNILDVHTGHWQVLRAAGEAPTPENGPAMTLAPGAGQHADAVYMFGGAEGSTLWRLSGNTTAGLPPVDGGGCYRPFDLRALHGVLMLLSWGVLLPVGVTIARFFRAAGPVWFKLHRALNVTGLLLALAALVVALLMVQTAKLSAVPHAFFGIAVMLLGLQQPINAYFRPHPPTLKTRRRLAWEWAHKLLGRTACVLGVVNPFWGISHLGQAHTIIMPVYSLWVAALVAFWIGATLAGYPGDENPSPLSRPFARMRAARRTAAVAAPSGDASAAAAAAASAGGGKGAASEGLTRRRLGDTEMTRVGDSESA